MPRTITSLFKYDEQQVISGTFINLNGLCILHLLQTIKMRSVVLLKGGCIECEGRDDAKDFSRIRSAMKILTFSEIQFQEILKLLAAILHLGNVSFEGEWIKITMNGAVFSARSID